MFVASFECDSYSSLNPFRADGPGSIAGDRGSGKTANACIRAVEKLRPAVFLGENVRQLAAARGAGPSDLEVFRQRLSAINYALGDFRVRAEDFGSPSPRDRISSPTCRGRTQYITN